MAPFITLDDLRKSFSSDHQVLSGVSLDVEDGEILVLLGPSGSGKTTLLRVIAGFETPDKGRILVSGHDITRQPPERRNFGMVFQHYALFPHLSVAENVSFGLHSRKLSRDEQSDRVAEVLDLVDLAGFEDRRVQQISGGQQQRVALARALAPGPSLMLLDEPLSNLDPDLRERTRRQLRRAVNSVGISAVWVTHEQEEAFDVADRIALLNEGRLEQVGTAEQLYREPETSFVAGFVGRATSLIGVIVEGGRVRFGDERFLGRGVSWPATFVGRHETGLEVEVVFRPESLELATADRKDALTARVESRHYAGDATFFNLNLDEGGSLTVRGDLGQADRGDRVWVGLRPDGPSPRAFPLSDEESA